MNSPPYINTKTLHLSADQTGLYEAVRILRHGGVVALPTETVYGLSANALDENAVGKIFSAKNRPHNNPLIVHTDTLANAEKLFNLKSMSEQQRLHKLALEFWPGPLTIVAHKASHIPSITVGGLDTVGVRIPRHEATLKILALLDLPLAMPSANQATRPSPTTTAHELKTLEGRIDALVEGGSCQVGIESTIIRIDQGKPVLLRLGMISQAMIEQCLGEQVFVHGHKEAERPQAPGCAYLHYSPRVASVRLCEMAHADEWWHHDVMLLLRKRDHAALTMLKGSRVSPYDQILSDDPNQFAQQLYHALHACEAWPHKSLVIIMPPQGEAYDAVRDRLQRTDTESK